MSCDLLSLCPVDIRLTAYHHNARYLTSNCLTASLALLTHCAFGTLSLYQSYAAPSYYLLPHL